jgi:hypothetical protein
MRYQDENSISTGKKNKKEEEEEEEGTKLVFSPNLFLMGISSPVLD